MGLESLLLSISFKKPLNEELIVDVFTKAGAFYLEEKSNISDQKEFRHWLFELRSSQGLTEIELMITPKKNYATTCSIRFSILSPSSVIDQTFTFLNKLKSLRSFKLFDAQLNSKELSLESEEFKKNIENELKRNIVLNNKEGLVIEGGQKTTDYIHEHKLAEKIWTRK